jgi:ubiquinol-cytochrome c reductase cytochrome b subunit
MLSSILIWLALPFVVWFNRIRSFSFKPLHKFIFFIFLITCILLTWLGGCPVVEPYYSLGQIFTILYFLIFVIIVSLSFIEVCLIDSFLYKQSKIKFNK